MAWMPSENARIKTEIVRTVFRGEASFTSAFCHVRQEKIKNVANRMNRIERLKDRYEGQISNNTGIKGKTRKNPKSVINGVHIIACSVLFNRREVKQAAE